MGLTMKMRTGGLQLDYEELESLIPASEFQRLAEEGGEVSTEEQTQKHYHFSLPKSKREEKPRLQ